MREVAENIIYEIADYLDAGFKCYLHKNGKKLIAIPDQLNHPEIEMEAWEDDIQILENSFDTFIEIENMMSGDSFLVMTGFIEILEDKSLQNRLANSIQRKKPFANFKFEINNADESIRSKWFEFKKNKLVEWVKRQINIEQTHASA